MGYAKEFETCRLTDKEKAFLAELEVLSRKYGVIVGGCGCCGSPWVGEAKESKLGEGWGYTYDPNKPGQRYLQWEERI